MKTLPWHREHAKVHHNNSDCVLGNRIEKESRKKGTGGLPLCERCKQLNKHW